MKILLVEDDSIVRECVESLVRKSQGALELLLADSIEQGYSLAAADSEVEVAFLGLNRERRDPRRLVRRFRLENDRVAIAVLGDSEGDVEVMQALNAGAMAFINRRASARALLNALRMVVDFGIYVPTTVLKARGLYNPQSHTQRASAAARIFSARRGERTATIARLMLHGCSPPAIALQLDNSEAIVRTELSALLKELSVTNRTQALLVLAAYLQSQVS